MENLQFLTQFYISYSDEIRDSKNTISELTRRLHEYELEIRRLENEREELTAAYKEAEAVSLKTWISCFLVDHNISCFREEKPKKSVPRAWLLNTLSSAMTLNAALPSRKKKLKLFGEYSK